MNFKDYSNPTEKELIAWSRDPDAIEPTQDWDLIIGRECYLDLLARLVVDNGPNTDLLLSFLYCATADSFKFHADGNSIEKAILLIPNNAPEAVLNWKKATENLLKFPKKFKDSDWYDY